MCIEELGTCAKLNDVVEPSNFKRNIRAKFQPSECGTGITWRKKYGRYQVQLSEQGKTVYYGSFITLEEAQEKAAEVLKQREQKKHADKPTQIERNEDGIAVLHVLKKEQTYEVLVDDDTWFELMQYTWYIDAGYARTRIKRKNISMHRFVLNLHNSAEKTIVDHKNNNRLDNRRNNLRIVNHALNAHNRKKFAQNSSSQYIGVILRNNGKYRSSILHCRKSYHLGTFEKEYDAAMARDLKAFEFYGDEATLNFDLETVRNEFEKRK